jgi:hypothetical protein
VQRIHELVRVEIAHLEPPRTIGDLPVVDDANAHRLDPGEIVVEGSGRLRGGVDAKALAQVGLDRPGIGAAAHRHAGEQQIGPVGRRLLDLLRQEHGRRRHDQLDSVLDHRSRLENQDVLRPGSDVDGQDPRVAHADRLGVNAPLHRGADTAPSPR